MKAELFRKPVWDKTNDPTIDPTLLDPTTGLPVNGKSIASLSKRHLFSSDEWAAIMIAAGLQTMQEAALSVPVSDEPAKNSGSPISIEEIKAVTNSFKEVSKQKLTKEEKAAIFRERMAAARAKKKAEKEALK